MFFGEVKRWWYYRLIFLSISLLYIISGSFSWFLFFFSVLAKRLVGKSLFKMTNFVWSATLNLKSVSQWTVIAELPGIELAV